MDSVPAGVPAAVQPTPPEANEDFVRAIIASNRQELKDILYDSCEQAVQKVAHRTLAIYLRSGGRMPPAADFGSSHPRSALSPRSQMQPLESTRSTTRHWQPLASTGTVFSTWGEEKASVVGATSSNEVRLQPRKVSLLPTDAPKERASRPLEIEPLMTDDFEALQRSRASSKSKIKAPMKKNILATLPRATSFDRRSMSKGARHTLVSAVSRPSSAANNLFNRRHQDAKTRGQGVFANAEDMKEKLRAALTEEPYDVANFYSEEGYCQAVARSTLMDNVTLLVIAFNALWMSIDVDLNDATIVTEASPVFQIMEHFFCLFFAVEISIRFGAFEVKTNCMRDRWFIFDSLLSGSMVIETWIIPIFVAAFATKHSGSYQSDASLFRGLRLARLMRMARVLRLLRALPELMVVIKGLFVAARAVSCTLLLMLMIIYVFAITFRQLTNDTEIGRTFFPTVPKTMRYLMVQGTMPDLYDPVHAIWDEGAVYALAFLIFIFITSITVMNMLVGIMVGVIDTVAAVEKESLTVTFVKDHLMTLLNEMQAEDKDKDGLVSKDEFDKLIQTPDAIKSFTAMGVDVVNLVDLGNFLFCEGEVEVGIPFGDFMELILQLRGSNHATVKDIVDLRRFVTMEMRGLFRSIDARLGAEKKSECQSSQEAAEPWSRSNADMMGFRIHRVKSDGAKRGNSKECREDQVDKSHGANGLSDQKYSQHATVSQYMFPGSSKEQYSIQVTMHEPQNKSVQPGQGNALLGFAEAVHAPKDMDIQPDQGDELFACAEAVGEQEGPPDMSPLKPVSESSGPEIYRKRKMIRRTAKPSEKRSQVSSSHFEA